MKKNMTFFAAIGVLVAIRLSRFIVGEYGENSRVIIMIAALLISILALVGMVYKKKYSAALGSLSMVLPLVVMTIGIYLDNIFISSVGFLLIFVLIPIMIKILQKYKK